MSNDLSNQLRSLNTFEWMARPATTKQICFDAANRIEKLEAALIAIKAMHHDGGIDDLQERDDRTYCMVCDALEGKDD